MQIKKILKDGGLVTANTNDLDLMGKSQEKDQKP